MAERIQQNFPLMHLRKDAVMSRFLSAISLSEPWVPGAKLPYTADLELASHAWLELKQRKKVADAMQAKFKSVGAKPISWLSDALEVVNRPEFNPTGKGLRSIYFILLDFSDSSNGPWGMYVGSTIKSPQVRFEEHVTGVRESRFVKRRGVQLLNTLGERFSGIKYKTTGHFEYGLAQALKAKGILVRGGH